MFGKLRFKFILISMLSVILVLGIIIAGINTANYNSTVRNADDILSMLADNDGHFPERDEAPPPPEEQRQDPSGSPELRFESRYFSVLIDGEGNILETDTGMIAAVDSAKAGQMALDVFSSKDPAGFEGDYRYLKVDNGSSTRVIFYDCGRSLDSFRSFLKASILISVIGAAVVFILIFFASGRILRPVAESYSKQKRFITDAGHEIKTPLAIINADADVILADGNNQWADDIKDQVRRLTGLTNDLIYLSKMEEGLPEAAFTDVDLSKLADNACGSFAAMFLTGNRFLTRNIGEKIHVKGDSGSLEKLMSILLDNACKYSPENSETSVVLKKTGRGIILSVTNDTKEPVDKESVSLLFDRFYRTDKSRSSGTGGYGIGLSVAKAVVNAHGGKISATPSGDNKLTVSVLLPD